MTVRVSVSSRAVALTLSIILVAACGTGSSSDISFDEPGVVAALASIGATDIDQHIRIRER